MRDREGRDRAVTTVIAVAVLAVAGCTASPAAAPVATPSAPERRATSTPTGLPTPTPTSTPTPEPTEQALAAYEQYTEALVAALEAGDADLPALAEAAYGQALEDAQARVQANTADGVVTSGGIETAAWVASSGEDTVVVEDCYVNNLAQVSADASEEVVAEASGNRRPVTATVARTDGGWQVTQVKGPQIRGPIYEEAASCAPPELEERLIAAYEAFWDAMYAAADPGNGEAADPAYPGLGETAVDPQLSDTRASLTDLRDKGLVSRGRIDTAAEVSAVLNDDTVATLVDCVIQVEGAGVFDAATGEVVTKVQGGRHSYVVTSLAMDDGVWKVQNYDIAKADSGCTRTGQ